MAHPDRAATVTQLMMTLGRSVPVAWDTEGPPSRDPDRIWRTARAGWELRPSGSDWHLLLQDDAIVHPWLLGALPGMLEHVPDECVVSLYLGRGRPVPGLWQMLCGEADQKGASFIVGPLIMWGVGLLIPTRLIPDMIAYADNQYGVPDDMRVGRWAKKRRYPAWYPWPSLADHPGEEKSLTKHGKGRVARKFAEADQLLSWSGPVVQYPGGRRHIVSVAR